MCIAFAKNMFCSNEGDCKYAHGPQELRGPHNGPPQAYSGGPQAYSGGPPGQYKTALCKNILEQGHCGRGDSCHFAHSSAELRAKKPTMGSVPMSSPFKRKRENVKTVLCQNYSAFGECQYMDNCSFAHGIEELSDNKRQKY